MTSNYHLETERDENKTSDPSVLGLPAASPSTEGEIIRSLNQPHYSLKGSSAAATAYSIRASKEAVPT